MPRADFYVIQQERFRDQPLLLVCELARKAFNAEIPTLILCRDARQAEELDDLLWAFDADAYIPHQIVGADEEEEATPVLLLTPEFDSPMRPMVINLRDASVPGDFERVLEVVPADPSHRDALRQRWKDYKDRGLDVNKHDM